MEPPSQHPGLGKRRRSVRYCSQMVVGRFRWERLAVLVLALATLAAALLAVWSVHEDHQKAADRPLCALLNQPSGYAALHGNGSDAASVAAIQAAGRRAGTHLGYLVSAKPDWDSTGQLQLTSEDYDYIDGECP